MSLTAKSKSSRKSIVKKVATSSSDSLENIENISDNKMSTRRTAAAPAATRRAEILKKEVVTTISASTARSKSKRRQIPVSSSSEASSDDESNNKNVTPPKQSKFVKNQDSKYSPSRLLERLSINKTEPKKIQSCSKFQSARKILNSAATFNLPGREKELQQLNEFFQNNLNDGTSASMYISGPPGTGKTACLSKLLNTSEFSDQFKKVYVNCTGISSVGSIYKKICCELKIKPGTEKESLLAIEKYLKGRHKTVLMVLDEIDQLVGQKQSVLYTIFEWPALAASKILLIGIANSLDLTDRLLSRLHAKCALKPKLMHFAPYSKQQIIDIFKSRLEEAGVIDLFPPATIQLLAAKVSAISGDVRRALDIGRRVVEMASEQVKNNSKIDLNELGIAELEPTVKPPAAERVEVKQVMTVLKQVYGATQTLDDDLESAFPLQQKILICSILLILKREKNKDITVGRLHGVYSKVCSIRNIPPVDQSEFASLCSLVETRGIVRVIRKGEPRLHKVQMQWDEEEVNDALQDKQLIASILADKNVTSK